MAKSPAARTTPRRVPKSRLGTVPRLTRTGLRLGAGRGRVSGVAPAMGSGRTAMGRARVDDSPSRRGDPRRAATGTTTGSGRFCVVGLLGGGVDGGRVGLADSLVHTPALHDLYQPPRRCLQGFVVVSADQGPHLRRYVTLEHAPGTGIGGVVDGAELSDLRHH